MKTLRRICYVTVAGMTLAFGVGAVAAVRVAYAAVSRLAASQTTRAVPLAEPVTSTPVLVEPIVVETTADETCGGTGTDGVDSPRTFDPTGDYWLDTDQVPRAFSDVALLTLQTREYVDEDGEYIDRPIVPRGSIQTKRELKLARIAIGDHDLGFQTKVVDGVSYRFVGQFLSVENYGEEGSMPDLKGRLIKIRNGKWAAEMEAEFYLQCGC